MAAEQGRATPLDTPVAEYNLAADRVGDTPEARLAWLIGFAQRDLSKLSRGQLLDLWFEVIVFTTKEQWQAVQRLEWAAVPADYTIQDLLAKLPPDVEPSARRIHEELRAVVQQFFERGIAHRDARVRYVVVRPSSVNAGPIVMKITGSLEDEFFITTFTLMSQIGDKLRRCEADRCGKPFVATRAQRFCGARCAQRMRTNRFRKRHVEKVSEIRHDAYVRRQRSKLGPKVKVARRPRRETT